jgi:hypothetical protein
LDLAVDGAELLSEQLLGLVDKSVKAILDVLAASLVAAMGNDLSVVRGTATVPGEELRGAS